MTTRTGPAIPMVRLSAPGAPPALLEVPPMDTPPPDARDPWLAGSRDCAHEPADLSYDHARFILAVHAGHGGGCRQYLAAAASCFRRTGER
ncbi:hypothetical protein NDR87_17625 [Nocardia sp. CDC159]|uniref:Uncharacterized protein n=1 Tax=Nocardia pulmonis TaxID=2951408 RepID=A0A9X2ECR1_9NOCA|nr:MULTISPECIES: hypothetical protein [Nocardia]MCM6775843.1 hypothetical protein [Nocardia pulmonis]MCM6788181.1 hypothetical protein [Nocardia sp. CDC159]